ncbi:hypothetical protein BST14_20440 [Mycobacterium arosiense ATCC BAA-1401 = DSM 45069]|uniref:Enoyl reductase (ER) domain-containing protein n=1 Tax=Mycobacterium arosiense ATCC BAA-1401 = DSM 45069 TaxID=1265311 RepID=A0A1W9ZAE2_MYCAI|nr:hypothetical protein BST14_20440 [Mycobacterium arosiense ATCC BAA-1401 = DSM 45069]
MPHRTLRIVSTAGPDALEIAVVQTPVPQPGPDEVIVRIDAAPIHPSDTMVLLGSADLTRARFGGTPDRPRVEIPLSPAARHAMSHRTGVPLPAGQEGAGVVVATGPNSTPLMGRKVAVLSSGSTGVMGLYAEYQTVAAADCIPLPDEVRTVDAAAMFVNPLTALAMVETLRLDAHDALIHTAAASSLGQMLVKICRDDGVPLVNVVRRPEQADLLRSLGATHVCDSSVPTFRDDLMAAIKDTGATVAFDAIGGGSMPGELLWAMEAAAMAVQKMHSPYGSFENKHVYIYGHLDDSPTVLAHHNYGLSWGVSGWLMPHVLMRIGRERTDALHQRILNELDTTFKTHYAQSITLSQALQPDVMNSYCQHATGAKYLIIPNIPT